MKDCFFNLSFNPAKTWACISLLHNVSSAFDLIAMLFSDLFRSGLPFETISLAIEDDVQLGKANFLMPSFQHIPTLVGKMFHSAESQQ